MTTRNAIENLVTATFANFHAFGEFIDGRFVSTFNPGRDDVASWGNPLQDVPIDLHTGYDLTQGTMAAHKFSDVPSEVVNVNGRDVDVSIEAAMRERREFHAWLCETGDTKLVYKFSQTVDNAKGYVKTNEGTDSVEFTHQDLADLLEPHLDTEPLYWVVSGQRRNFAKLAIVLLAVKRGVIKSALDYEFILEQREFIDFESTLEMILEENRTNAKQAISEVGCIRAACGLLNNDPLLGERAIGQKLSIKKRGQQQKVYRAAKLANALTKLNLADRLIAEPKYVDDGSKTGRLTYVKGGFIPTNKLNATDLQSLLCKAAKCSAPVESAYKRLNKTYKKGSRPSLDVVETYLQSVIEGTLDVKSRGMNRDELQACLDTERTSEAYAKVGDVLRAILNNDAAFWSELNPTEHTQDNAYTHAPYNEGDE